MGIIKRVLYGLKMRIIKLTDKKDTAKVRRYYKEKYDISIGKYTYGYNISNIAGGSQIGNFCSIATGVKIGLMNHPTEYVSTNPFLYYSSRGFINKDKNIPFEVGAVIEDDVWLGADAIILPGITVGKGAIVGAGAVVTKDVAPYEIVGGVSGKAYKMAYCQ